MCRAGAADIQANREEFAKRGVSLYVVTSQTAGIDDFKEAVWAGGDVLLDEGEVFKLALGGKKYQNRWLMTLSVIRRITASASLGAKFDDLNEKSAMLGGAILVNKDGVIFAEAETSGFVYPTAATLLSTLDGSNSCEKATPATADTM